jgi:hypothetical protein
LYVDPLSEEKITAALTLMDSDEELRKNLVMKAKVQREKFSWDKTAAAMWKSIEKAMSENQ